MTREETREWREALRERRDSLMAEMRRGARENWPPDRRLELVARIEEHNQEARRASVIQPYELEPRDGDWDRWMFEAEQD